MPGLLGVRPIRLAAARLINDDMAPVSKAAFILIPFTVMVPIVWRWIWVIGSSGTSAIGFPPAQ